MDGPSASSLPMPPTLALSLAVTSTLTLTCSGQWARRKWVTRQAGKVPLESAQGTRWSLHPAPGRAVWRCATSARPPFPFPEPHYPHEPTRDDCGIYHRESQDSGRSCIYDAQPTTRFIIVAITDICHLCKTPSSLVAGLCVFGSWPGPQYPTLDLPLKGAGMVCAAIH